MTPLALLPSWFPTEAAFVGLLVFVLAVIAMNRQNATWVVDNGILSPTNAVLVAAGVFLFLGRDAFGIVPLPGWVWISAGTLVAVLGLASHSDRVDFDLSRGDGREG